VHVASGVPQARDFASQLPEPIGFVPTMGALHEGHLDLVRRAMDQSASVVVSIFVNPLQFAPGEDLARYPRDLDGDRTKLARLGVDLLFMPTLETMYPPGFSTTVDVGSIGTTYEGAARPTHFRGVTTIVTKLLHVLDPDMLYLGQKDAQQTAVLRAMIRDLDMNVRAVIVPTHREADGLAMSSRNIYLSPELRAAAPSLHQALVALRSALERGDAKADGVAEARARVSPLAQLDYLDVVDADRFEPIEHLRPPAFIIGAARFGETRLIDNLWFER
jgi:pantoate--beta-alanine ligase